MDNCANSQNLQRDFHFNVDSQWEKLRLGDEEDKNTTETEDPAPQFENKALRMMQIMGYKSGLGLGKNKQGIINAIEVSTQLGRRGLGHCLDNFQKSEYLWDRSQENVNAIEEVEWLPNNSNNFIFTLEEMREWPVQAQRIIEMDSQHNFCEENILTEILQAKNIFNELDLKELWQARTRANPFETIRSVFFMNRAALKMANIDAATDFMFTSIDLSIHHKGDPLYYFADVCAGPGGFTEYILWRKKWTFKGFGLTLKHENDFRLSESVCASPVTFQAFYGSEGDGNVCNPENIEDFRVKVLHETDGKGVHFMMSDGGFSVEGNENLQEVLSKNIYLCQCLVALEILRPHGHFVTKVFDLFTTFSVGLLFLMYQCFEKVCIFKPNSSRPANSERYLICNGLKDSDIVQKIRQYLKEIANKLWEIKDDCLDLTEIVSVETIKNDKQFYDYIYKTNNRLARNQAVNLRKLAVFCRNPSLQESRQEEMRESCLKYWQIPDKPRVPQKKIKVEDLLAETFYKKELLLVQPREYKKIEQFFETINSTADLKDWHYAPIQCGKSTNMCNFYAAVGTSRVFRFQYNKWMRAKNLQLCRGTLLYGELVKEKCLTSNLETVKHSLHVIDALRLGDLSLSELKFEKRRELIETFCKSVNHENRPYKMRVRAKIVKPLDMLANIEPICELPVFGFNAESEFHDVNSILLLKTNENQSFHSTYVLRGQVFLKSERFPEDGISLDEFKDLVKKILKK